MQDAYSLLSAVVRSANSPHLPHHGRFTDVLRIIANAFHFTSASLYLADSEGRNLTTKIHESSSCISSCYIPFGEGIAGSCAAARSAIFGPKEHLHEDEVTNGRERAFFALPLVDGRSLYGVLTCGLTSANPPDEAAQEYLANLLFPLRGLVHDYRVSEEYETRPRLPNVLEELGKLLNRSLPFREIVPLILRLCQKQIAASCCFLRICPGQESLPEGIYQRVNLRYRPYLWHLLQIEKISSEKVAESLLPSLTQDLIADEDLPYSYICVPILVQSRLIGTLTVFGKTLRDGRSENFREEDREFLWGMASVVATAIESSINYRKMLSLAEENRRKLKEMFLLYRIGNLMLSTMRLDRLISLVLTSLTAGTTPLFDRAMLFLLNEKAGNLQGMLGVTRETASCIEIPSMDEGDFNTVPWNISEEDLQKQASCEFSRKVAGCRIQLDPSRNVSSRAVTERRMLHVANVSRERAVDRDFTTRFGITSFAVAPLIARDKVVGVLVVDNGLSDHPLKPSDLNFLQLFTNLAGMAIDNSMLYNRLKDANRDLRDAQERLIQGERLAAVGEMAASIAHELKGPLVSMGGFARKLARRLHADQDGRRYAHTIAEEVSRLELMLSDILSFSKKTTICYTVCDMVTIIEDTLNLVSERMEEGGIVLKRSYGKNIPSLLADCHQMKQVFLNLFQNAIEAMREGGTLTITVATTRMEGTPAVSVKIADTGRGIPPDIVKNIFNPFFTTKATGTGLGLPIVQRIVTNHLGRIRVNSKPGAGAEFKITIPATA